MISKTQINKRMKLKTNSALAKVILLAKKHNLEIAQLLSRPTRRRIKINLEQLNDSKEGETLIIPGKVLGSGELRKKIKIIAWNFSKTALEKIKKTKSNFAFLSDEIKKKNLKDAKIIK